MIGTLTENWFESTLEDMATDVKTPRGTPRKL